MTLFGPTAMAEHLAFTSAALFFLQHGDATDLAQADQGLKKAQLLPCYSGCNCLE